MKFIKIKTRKFLPPQDDIFRLLDESLPNLEEGDVVFITSKILAIHQGRCFKINSNTERNKLIQSEANYTLPKTMLAGSEIFLTIKDHTLILSSGVDRSNAKGYHILWPKNTNQLCKQICRYLKKNHKIKKLAVVSTDSHTTPLRWGTTGISIGFWGMKPTYDYRGKTDIFGRKLKYTQSNILDSLSAMAVLLMGEGNEKIPIVIARGLDFIRFTNKNSYKNFVIDPKQDLYYPLLKIFKKT